MGIDAGTPVANRGYVHEAIFYDGIDEFVPATLPFVLDAVEAGVPILVVLERPRLEVLREALGDAAANVDLRDMAVVGRNPACIIPAWQAFLDDHPDRPVRGIGEPAFANRSAAELDECGRHESLLNIAFTGDPDFHLLCPYDVSSLPAAVIDDARRNHPWLSTVGQPGDSRRREGEPDYGPVDVLGGSLPPPPADSARLLFASYVVPIRDFVGHHGAQLGLGAAATAELVQAVHEVGSNSIIHAGGTGSLQIWSEGDRVVVEIADKGRIADPLVGRRDSGPARGLRLANRTADLVQIRSDELGTTVRIHKQRD